MNVRAEAARVLGQVCGQGASLSSALPPALAKTKAQDRGLLQELCYGVCRWQPLLQFQLDKLLRHQLAASEVAVRALLLLGLYQLQYLRIPAHAAVAETVAAAHTLGKPWAVGLTNAVLRNALRRDAELKALCASDAVAASAHPAWLLERLQCDWPADWQHIVAANNQRPPMTLRVNRQVLSASEYQTILGEQRAALLPEVESALLLPEAQDVLRLPGFHQGWVSVQDAAAQCAALLLDLHSGQRVLDACAAPGGKTGHILECAPDIALTAIDQDAQRLELVHANLQRLGLEAQAQLLVGDARQPAQWWDGLPYQRILLDAPCSASGVIRRHPDIKLLRRAPDIATLAAQQLELLHNLWPLLSPNGSLLYATCSVLHAENEQVIAAFLTAHPDAQAVPLNVTWGRALRHGRQILPGEANMDGFYYAGLRKAPLAESG